MKKLLFVHVKLVCGGAENALFNLLNLLDKSKYDISVLVLNDGGEWEQKFQDAGIRVIHCYDRQYPGQRIRNYILRKRIDYTRNHFGKGLIPLATGKKYDLIIDYHTIAHFKRVCQGVSGKKIKYIHGDVETNPTLRGFVDAIRGTLLEYDHIICVSKEARGAFVRMMAMEDKSGVCYNPIDSQQIITKAEEPVCDIPLQKYICAVGRLSEEKGFSRLISIHKKLIDQGLEHSLVIVGDGPQWDELQDQIRRLSCHDSVVMTGYRANPYGYMKNSLFTVCSSFTEGLPVIAMESLCLGVPVVSAYPSVGELFGEECCGIITGNDDSCLEEGIRKMLVDTEFYRRAKAGAEKRSQVFSSETMVKQVERIYDTVMEEI